MVYPIEKHFKSSKTFLSALKTKPESYWQQRGEQSALKLFHEMSLKVPAYKKFLKQNNIFAPSKIKTIKDFKNIPLISKDTYLKKNKLPSLCWDGIFSESQWVISSTSGSTGEPFYFPRSINQDLQYALTAELYLITNFDIDKKKTLYINGFAMGVWIGGLFTYQAIKHIADTKKYALSIISPGINKIEILKAMVKLGQYFDQVIIGGYPPFIKDFIDYSISEGFNWKKANVKFIFSAEGFSEKFRDYIVSKAHLKNTYKDTLNHYGTVDIGTQSYETPISILVRRLALSNKKFFQLLFGNTNKSPTLTQYIPEQFYFESIDNGLVCSSASGLPLVRYDLKDHGGVCQFGLMVELAKKSGIDILMEAKKANIFDTLWYLPFVYVFERADFSVSFYGANIYPETIRGVLIGEQFQKYFTGKCSLEINFTKSNDQTLHIHVELKNGVKTPAGIKKRFYDETINTLLKENSEFRNNYVSLGTRGKPVIKFWPYESENYFRPGGKQIWIKK
jgi:phenylacetate-coenzyme A ligase PaaK-like adenylate-forming protein